MGNGVYTKNTGSDFPTVNLYENNLVYDSTMEYHSPTITHGLATWNQNLGSAGYYFSIHDYQFHTIPSPAEQISMLESWLTWRNPDDRKGLYLLPVISFGSLLDAAGQAPFDNEMLKAKKIYSVEELQKMSAPEILALWEEALMTSNFEMINLIASDEDGITY